MIEGIDLTESPPQTRREGEGERERGRERERERERDASVPLCLCRSPSLCVSLRPFRSLSLGLLLYRQPSYSQQQQLLLSCRKAKADAPAPALYFLSGLTCTHENFVTKGNGQKSAAEAGIVIVCPDTSPRGVPVEGKIAPTRTGSPTLLPCFSCTFFLFSSWFLLPFLFIFISFFSSTTFRCKR